MTDSNHNSNLEADLAAAMAGEKRPVADTTLGLTEQRAPAFAKPAIRAVAVTGTATVITPASIRSENNSQLNAIADERKALTGEIGGIDEQMNRLLDQRNAAISRMGELAQAEAMIRAAQTVGNAPRWTQG